ncbi:MAG: ABC transporter substrate-binding protein [Microthrixaceae bacterium]
MKPDGSGVAPGLAEEWQFDAPTKTWTFTLRANAQFRDGTPVTSADVVFSADIWKNGPNFGNSYARIETVEAPDPQTVKFVLSEPDLNFEAVIAASIAGVVPKDFGGKSEDDFYTKPIGAGAYKVDSWSAGGKIELSRNQHFYGSKTAGPNSLTLDVVADDNERAIMFESGDADIVEYVPATATARYQSNELNELDPSQISHVSLNVNMAPFDDINIRKAVAAAIDYKSIVRGAYDGKATVPTGLIPPNLPRYAPPSNAYFTTDVDAAKKLLNGTSAENGVTTEIIYDAGVESDALAAQIVIEDLAKIGITVKATGLETAAFLDRAFGADAPMVLWTFGAVSPDVIDPVNWISGTGWLFSGQDTAKLIEQSGAYATSSDDASAKKIIEEIQNEAINDAAAIALAQFNVRHAVKPSISMTAAPWGLYYYDQLSSNG